MSLILERNIPFDDEIENRYGFYKLVQNRTLVTIGYIHSCKKIDYFLPISEKNKIPGIFPKFSSSAKNSKALR